MRRRYIVLAPRSKPAPVNGTVVAKLPWNTLLSFIYYQVDDGREESPALHAISLQRTRSRDGFRLNVLQQFSN